MVTSPFQTNGDGGVSMRLKPPYFLGIAGLLASPLTGLADELRIENIAGGDTVVVVMDSRYSAGPTWWCRSDEVLRTGPTAADPTTGKLALGNVPAAAGCNSEIAVFAAQNAMELSTPLVTPWTDSASDTYTIPLRPIIDVPVSIWIANDAARVRAEPEIANATLIYRNNKVGVQFVATVYDATSEPAMATIGNSCNSIGRIRSSTFYTPNTLNIYYVKDDIRLPPELGGTTTPLGLTCDRFGDGVIKGDANIIFIGPQANLAVVSHEVGHAFGLRPGTLDIGKPAGGHTQNLKGFGPNNVMCTGGCPQTRDHFSLGQAFRMNTQADEWGGTMLIANGLRPGPGRACPPLTTSDICPPLALDWSSRR
jgi:hypothetical protein